MVVLWLFLLVCIIMCDVLCIKICMMLLIICDLCVMLLCGDIDLVVGFFFGVIVQLVDGQGMVKSQISYVWFYIGQYVCVMYKNYLFVGQLLMLDSYCSVDYLLVSLFGKFYVVIDDVLVGMNCECKILLMVNQFFMVGCIVVSFELIIVLLCYLVVVIGMVEVLVVKELFFQILEEYVDMFWYECDVCNFVYKWLCVYLFVIIYDEFGCINMKC